MRLARAAIQRRGAERSAHTRAARAVTLPRGGASSRAVTRSPNLQPVQPDASSPAPTPHRSGATLELGDRGRRRLDEHGFKRIESVEGVGQLEQVLEGNLTRALEAGHRGRADPRPLRQRRPPPVPREDGLMRIPSEVGLASQMAGPSRQNRPLIRGGQREAHSTANTPIPRCRPDPIAMGPTSGRAKRTRTWNIGPLTLSGRR